MTKIILFFLLQIKSFATYNHLNLCIILFILSLYDREFTDEQQWKQLDFLCSALNRKVLRPKPNLKMFC